MCILKFSSESAANKVAKSVAKKKSESKTESSAAKRVPNLCVTKCCNLFSGNSVNSALELSFVVHANSNLFSRPFYSRV